MLAHDEELGSFSILAVHGSMGYHSPQLGSVSLHYGKTVKITQTKECFHSDHESGKVANKRQL